VVAREASSALHHGQGMPGSLQSSCRQRCVSQTQRSPKQTGQDVGTFACVIVG
jgi:hypothetical protein